MTDGEKIKPLMKARGITPPQLAVVWEFNTTDMVYKVLRNERRITDPDKIEAAAELLGVRPVDLIDDTYLKLFVAEERAEYNAEVISIPIVGEVSSGSEGTFVDRNVIEDRSSGLYGDITISNRLLGARILDNAMMPRFFAREILLLDESLPITPGAYCQVETKSGDIYIRRVIQREELLILVPEAPDVGIIEIDKEDIKSIKRVAFVALDTK